MDVTLVLVTLLSLALAAIMTVLAWRLAHEERRRSNARVAALAAELERTPGAGVVPRATNSDLPLHHPIPVVTSGDLFSATANERAPGLPRGVAAVLITVGVVACAIFVWSIASRAARASSASSAPGRAAAAQRATPAAAAPLELIALTHDRDAAQLTVRGVVRNPASGAAVRGLTAVVFLLNSDGGFITSGRATIDALAPGSESPFAVTFASAGDTARYRVSFRTGDEIVPHVDRRDRPFADARQP